MRPGRNESDVTSPFRGTRVTATVRRDGGGGRWQSALGQDDAEGCDGGVDGEHALESASPDQGQPPTSDIMFKCVDAATTVVVGAAVDKEEGAPDGVLSETASLAQTYAGTCRVNDHGQTPDLPDTFAKEGAKDCPAAKNVVDSHRGSTDRKGEDALHSRYVGGLPRGPDFPLDHAVRPQVCVPLVGIGDSGCIGMIGAQGFTTKTVVGDDDWCDWYAARMAPLNENRNHAVKRLKLVRPRGLPTIGRLKNSPSGVAAKVVYGTVQKVARKRGMPVYSVR